MKTIQEGWDTFSAAIFKGIKVSEVQRTEMERAFFAGATHMLICMKEMGDLPDDDDDEKAMQYIDERFEECVAYYDRIRSDTP